MAEKVRISQFVESATKAGAEVLRCESPAVAADYIQGKAAGCILLPSFASAEHIGLGGLLREAGCELVEDDFRARGPAAMAGVTGANFAIADTGTVVLESTPEAIRLATTLPERHFVLVDPRKIVADGLEAAGVLRQFHQQQPRNYLAYITGPSRTADIERVLTIGVHGPRELHILLLEGLSDDPLEM